MADQNPIPLVAASLIALLALTGTIASIRNKTLSPPMLNLSANTALALSLLTALAGAIIHTQKGPNTLTPTGFTFSILYMLGFAWLQTDQPYGLIFGLLVSFCMVGTSMLRTGTARFLPVERNRFAIFALACFGVEIFGIAVHFWVGLACSICLAVFSVFM
ncbi:uncharacterized protein N7529_011424 [Penicillium soppii]|jgi:uncharacterized membrane protein (UPF0136 family)|uniref:uncharacterized protein n=1 Tax=Penicillium soppii TaxID=69789 RepID=UPI002548474B|nr:uncharacterized protein N7529_011424 [Penicillium soppii]KAJ5852039.1 hypothetical protein N7529_011424 [Penicillium soppii]